MKDNRKWWEKEFLSTQTNRDIINWLESQDKIAKHKEKERIIRKAFDIEIKKIQEEINKLYEEKRKKEKECEECLAKISSGDTGLMEILAERNTIQ